MDSSIIVVVLVAAVLLAVKFKRGLLDILDKKQEESVKKEMHTLKDAEREITENIKKAKADLVKRKEDASKTTIDQNMDFWNKK